MGKHKPSRRLIKKAIRHMATLSGLPMRVWRNYFKQRPLRNIEHYLGCNVWSPMEMTQALFGSKEKTEIVIQPRSGSLTTLPILKPISTFYHGHSRTTK